MSLLLLESVGSTQDELVSHLRSGSAYDAVAAGQQTGGRGRFGRAWSSPPGASLALSVALPMPDDPASAPYIGMALAARAARRYGVAVQWPNDVTSGGRKLGGILIEGQEIEGERRLVVGIGINLGQTVFPEEIAHRATSLLLVDGKERDWREEARALDALVREPAPRSFPELAPFWSLADETPGKRYRSTDETIGVARGIDPEGRLLLEGSSTPISVAEAYFGRS